MSRRIIQNFLLIWLNSNSGEKNDNDYENTLSRIRQIVTNIYTFNDTDQCIDFLTDVQNEKVFLILSSNLSELILPLIHDITRLNTIFILSQNESRNKQWINNYSKVKDIFTQISIMYEALKHTAQQCEQDAIPISFIQVSDVGSKPNLDQLDQLFMYTQILKDIVLEMNFDEQSVTNFTTHYRQHLTNNSSQISIIDEFERDYYDHLPIWWYTRPSILYSMLNRALRLMDIDIVVKMGFFVRDLHENIKQIHSVQDDHCRKVGTFIVYRGQGLSTTDFDKLRENQGGLISFNNFLSTSADRDIAFIFADSNQMNSDSIGVLFKMTIDRSVASTPFAFVKDISYFSNIEEEILFSMHAIFRIDNIKQLNENERLWEVELTLTSDSDEQLQILTNQIREEIRGKTSWIRLGKFLIRVNRLDQAEELYQTLLDQTTNDEHKGHLYNQLGCVRDEQGYHKEAILLYEKALEYRQKYLHRNHPELAAFYRNVGIAYFGMADYSKARSFYEKAFEIWKKILPFYHRDLALIYGDLASVYFHMNDYSKALEFTEKELEINEKVLVANHPDLAVNYDNIGTMYYGRGEYSKSLSFYRKALEIKRKILPSDHSDLADSLRNIGGLYDEMGQSVEAIRFLKEALVIYQKTLPSHHQSIIITLNSIGAAYGQMNDYSEALSFCTKALEISEQTFPLNKYTLAYLCNNIGMIYIKMNEYSEALAFYHRALEFLREDTVWNQQYLSSLYNNIGGAYQRMTEYSKALPFFEKAFEIDRTIYSPNHPSLAINYNNIGGVFYSMGDYSKALEYFEKVLEISENILPSDHPHLLVTYQNIAVVHSALGNNSKAVFFYAKAYTTKQ